MGTGHTLTAASYMVFLDTPYTFGLFDQACDRIHRIGTKNPVFIYNLIATGTIDEKVAFILEKKKALVIADEGFHILALVGHRIDDSVKVTKATATVTVIRLI